MLSAVRMSHGNVVIAHAVTMELNRRDKNCGVLKQKGERSGFAVKKKKKKRTESFFSLITVHFLAALTSYK